MLFVFLQQARDERLDMLMYYADQLIVMFNFRIRQYLVQNVGRSHYEYVARLLKKIRKFPGGYAMVWE